MKARGTRRKERAVVRYTHVVSFTCDDDTLQALDALINRLTIDGGQPVTTSAAIRRAVVYMEKLTRKGEGNR